MLFSRNFRSALTWPPSSPQTAALLLQTLTRTIPLYTLNQLVQMLTYLFKYTTCRCTVIAANWEWGVSAMLEAISTDRKGAAGCSVDQAASSYNMAQKRLDRNPVAGINRSVIHMKKGDGERLAYIYVRRAVQAGDDMTVRQTQRHGASMFPSSVGYHTIMPYLHAIRCSQEGSHRSMQIRKYVHRHPHTLYKSLLCANSSDEYQCVNFVYRRLKKSTTIKYLCTPEVVHM
jgi:hypothetical protein